METVSLHEAKARLSQLVNKAAAGEDVLISREGQPAVRITRLNVPKPSIRFGLLAGKVKVAADFDGPLLPAEFKWPV